jgi:hypothetical protein
LDVEERRESLPGTLQKMSVGRAVINIFSFMLMSRLKKKENKLITVSTILGASCCPARYRRCPWVELSSTYSPSC